MACRNKRYLSTWLLLAAILIGTALGFYRLEAKSLWGDEIITATNSQVSGLAALWSNVHGWSNQRPLHDIITYAGTFCGTGEFWLRLPSVFFGILGIVTLYRVGQVLFGEQEGALAAFLLALSPLQLQYSQEARPYALFSWLSLLSLLFLLYAQIREQRRWWVGFTLVSILNLYTHYFSFFVLAAEVGVIGLFSAVDYLRAWKANGQQAVALQRQARRLVVLTVATMATGLALLPSTPYIIRLLRMKGGGAIPPRVISLSMPFLVDVLSQLSVGVLRQIHDSANMQIFAGFFLLGLLTCGRERRYRSLLLAVVWLAFPFVALSLIPSSKHFNIRFVIFVLPMFLLVVAKGVIGAVSALQRLTKRWFSSRWEHSVGFALMAGVVISVGLLSIAPLRLYYALSKSPWREVGAFLDSHVRPEDVVLIDPPYERKSLRYYSDLDPIGAGIAAEQVLDMADAGSAVWYVSSATYKNDTMDQWLPRQAAVNLIFAGYNSGGNLQDMHIWLYKKVWQEDNNAALREGEALIAEAAQLYPEALRKELALAQLYTRFDYPDQAVAYYEQALPKVPPSLQVEIYMELGHIFEKQEKAEAALHAYQRAIELRPTGAWLYVFQGDLLLRMQEPDRALDVYRQAAELNPAFEQESWYHVRLGNSYRQVDEADKAIAAYERALALEPKNTTAEKWLNRLRSRGE